MRLLAVDPGVRMCGVALFELGRLKRAGLARCTLPGNVPYRCMAEAVMAWAGDVDVLATERPQQYPHAPTPRSSVQALEGVVGAVQAIAGTDDVHTYTPAMWKGQVPKGVMYGRIVQRLSETERGRAAKAVLSVDLKRSIHHNALDAVGVGLYHLGRLRRRML